MKKASQSTHLKLSLTKSRLSVHVLGVMYRFRQPNMLKRLLVLCSYIGPNCSYLCWLGKDCELIRGPSIVEVLRQHTRTALNQFLVSEIGSTYVRVGSDTQFYCVVVPCCLNSRNEFNFFLEFKRRGWGVN